METYWGGNTIQINMKQVGKTSKVTEIIFHIIKIMVK
jgi:hypothetical protein